MIETGIKNEQTIVVSEDQTAEKVKSGGLPVYATPEMIALIEATCFESVSRLLEEGQGTVGTLLNIRHNAPTPVGMKVTCRSELVEVDRRRLVFKVEVTDEAGPVGEGTHERFIIDEAKFMAKVAEKEKLLESEG